jgi:hypothetical protein
MKKSVFLLIFMLTGLSCAQFTPPVIVSFSVSPSTISTGESATLIWNVAGADAVTIIPGPGNVSLAGMLTVNPSTTTIYVITASNSEGSISATTILVVSSSPQFVSQQPVQQQPAPSPPVIPLFTINPALIGPGQSATLRWNVMGATLVSIYPDIGNVPFSGSQQVKPFDTTTYTLTASNGSAQAIAAATVTLNQQLSPPPSILNFTIVPMSIYAGQPATLIWSTLRADSVSIDNGVGVVTISGSQSVSPFSTTTYTLTATNSSGAITSTTTVYVYSAPYLPTPYSPMPMPYPPIPYIGGPGD